MTPKTFPFCNVPWPMQPRMIQQHPSVACKLVEAPTRDTRPAQSATPPAPLLYPELPQCYCCGKRARDAEAVRRGMYHLYPGPNGTRSVSFYDGCRGWD